MPIRLSTNALQIARQLGQTASKILEAADKSLQRVGEKVEQTADRFIERIYERPANGWERSGDLQDGLHLDRPSKISATVEIIGRAATYARPRHDLDRPGRDGITRSNPFFDQTEEAEEPALIAKFENEFQNELDL